MTQPVQNSTGAQVCVISTEHTLATITQPGFYSLWLDLNALAASDTLEMRVKTKVTSGGTSRLHSLDTYNNAQTLFNITTQTIECMHEVVFTIKQTAGTGRTVNWEILSY